MFLGSLWQFLVPFIQIELLISYFQESLQEAFVLLFYLIRGFSFLGYYFLLPVTVNSDSLDSRIPMS